MPPSARSLRDPFWRSLARPPALDSPALPLLFACEGTGACLSRQVCRRPQARLSSRRTRLSRQSPTTRHRESFSCFPPAALSSRLGGLRQTPLRLTRACASLPGALHAPRRHLQSSPPVRRRRQGQLPMEGLRARRQATQDDGHCRRVPASLHAPCPATRVRPDSLFRLPRQSAPETTSSPL